MPPWIAAQVMAPMPLSKDSRSAVSVSTKATEIATWRPLSSRSRASSTVPATRISELFWRRRRIAASADLGSLPRGRRSNSRRKAVHASS
jgi:hypothetical protein